MTMMVMTTMMVMMDTANMVTLEKPPWNCHCFCL